jgi:hypothetical protein
LDLTKQILEKAFGVRFTLLDGQLLADGGAAAGQSAAVPVRAQGIQTDTTREQEQEQTSFSASGSVTTTDGQIFTFQLDSLMQRNYQGNSSTTRHVGTVDPLMITLPDGGGRLNGASVSFNLQGTGQKVALPFMSGGGWLVWDKNHDGKISDGSQLFGPQSGDGFNDLAALDSNHDGVIDAGDPVYADLKVWTGVDSQGNDQLTSLAALHIGAILLPSVATPFSLRDTQNRTQGEVSRSGVYLTDNGQAGCVSQIDIAV